MLNCTHCNSVIVTLYANRNPVHSYTAALHVHLQLDEVMYCNDPQRNADLITAAGEKMAFYQSLQVRAQNSVGAIVNVYLLGNNISTLEIDKLCCTF